MASCSSGPSAASSTSVPWLAASIITCMMLRASTSRPLARSVILLSNRDAVVTSLLVARACSPSLLMMVMGRQIMAASDLPPGLQVWQFGVAYLHVAVLLAEVLAQLFANVDRTVLAAGAANGDGHVAAITVGEGGQPGVQEAGEVVHHLFGQGLPFQEVDHRLVGAGVLAQAGIPVRIGQAAHIKYIIGIHRHAVLEAERLEDRKSTRLNSSHVRISYAVFCLKK